MAKWDHTVNIKHIWENDGLCASDKGKEIAKILIAKFPNDEEIRNICSEFEDLEHLTNDGEDEDEVIYQFDLIMRELYDWGDVEMSDNWPHRRCFIATF